jgi:hypothetical protein
MTGLVTEAAKMRPRNGSDPVTLSTNTVIRNLARRIQHLNTEMASIDLTHRSNRRATYVSILGGSPDGALLSWLSYLAAETAGSSVPL